MSSYFFISHLIQVFLFPPGPNLLLGGIGFFIKKKWHLIGKSLIFISFVSLWLLSLPIISWQLMKRLEYQYFPLQINNFLKKNLKNSAIVVLGGGEEPAPEYEKNRAVSEATLHRLSFAAYLYHQTNLPIIVSGGGQKNASYTEADLMEEILKNTWRIPIKWKENKSTTTIEESQYLVPFLKKHEIYTIYLVTHAWHIPRSIYIFKNTGINVIPAPMGYTMMSTNQSLLDYLPSIVGLNNSVTALHEYVGLIWYHFIKSDVAEPNFRK